MTLFDVRLRDRALVVDLGAVLGVLDGLDVVLDMRDVALVCARCQRLYAL